MTRKYTRRDSVVACADRIIALHNEGLTHAQIAERIGFSKSSVYLVVRAHRELQASAS